jgi:hypothetical protein
MSAIEYQTPASKFQKFCWSEMPNRLQVGRLLFAVGQFIRKRPANPTMMAL